MTDHEHGERHSHQLVMPFVVVESKDGPYDDLAYAAGYEAGTLDQFLASVTFVPGACFHYPVAVRKANAPQLDLIAMKHGLAAAFEPTEVDEWLALKLERRRE